ncbi:type II toxin-antitoxin system RelE/ParE family toxin [Ensifer sp. LCM 4579]|uniref:type II toxin-antitoxin system RelE/ParE family toxin n=1 Tax=Ensifer sp. LCM 4579 TaxID=1848292 RepID=UPI0008D93166|nr:type II toxin-antitoxin system RelE/ParE family toxin [Ensifer sp. LCM 4579]OHV83418.1 plasmid stabilization protein [Ensifer sp. LCM 4579]
MPQVVYAPAALRDIERLRIFLCSKNPSAARRAGDAIIKGVRILGSQPHMGRPVEDLPENYREWVIEFGAYVVRYRIDDDVVTILLIRHGREAGF